MSMVDQDRVACRACGRQYQWMIEFAGKTFACECGQAVVVPQRLIELAPVKAKACPFCRATLSRQAVVCMSCGLDLRTGRKIHTKAPATPAAPPKSPKTRNPSGRPAVERTEEVPFSATADIVLPVALVLVGFLLTFLEVGLKNPGRDTGAVVLSAGIIGVILNLAFVLAALLLASMMGGISFTDTVPVIALKASAAALAPGAIGGILDQWVGGMGGTAIGIFSTLGLSWGLFAFLFKMPTQDIAVCVMLAWIIRVGTAYVMFRVQGILNDAMI